MDSSTPEQKMTQEQLKHLAELFKLYLKLNSSGNKETLAAIDQIKSHIEADSDIKRMIYNMLKEKLAPIITNSDESSSDESSSYSSDYSDDSEIKVINSKEEKEEEEEEKEEEDDDVVLILITPFDNLKDELEAIERDLYHALHNFWNLLTIEIHIFEDQNGKDMDPGIMELINKTPNTLEELYTNFTSAYESFVFIYCDEIYQELFKHTFEIEQVFDKIDSLLRHLKFDIPKPEVIMAQNDNEEEEDSEEQMSEESKTAIKQRKNRHTPFQNLRSELEKYNKGTYFRIWRKWSNIIINIEEKLLKETKLAMTQHLVNDVITPIKQYAATFDEFRRNIQNGMLHYCQTIQQLRSDYPHIKRYINRVYHNFYDLKALLDDIVF